MNVNAKTRLSKRELVGGAVVIGVSLFASVPARADEPAPAADGGALVDRREIIVPVPPGSVEALRIDNPMGRVEIRGGGRTDSIHVIAEKHAATADALARLRVHYTAFQSGEIQLDTRVELEGRERSVPLGGSGIDLIVEVPADVAVAAKTFGGDVTASGLRAGARLETTGGHIGVTDVRGGVVTRQLRGGQIVSGVEGDVDLDGVEGDMDLRRLVGGHVDARLVDGNIHAEDVRAAFVRLTTTTGEIVLLGPIRAATHYDLRSYAGDVRMVVVGEPSPFELRARSAAPVESGFPLRASRHEGEWLHATFPASARATSASMSSRMALIDVSSVLARVMIQPNGGPGASAVPSPAAEPH
jgi:Putative adhesin